MEAQGPDRAGEGLPGRAPGIADQAFFDAVEEESDELAAHVRKGCLEMPDPEPLSIFDHVYAERHPLVEEERAQFARLPRHLRGEAH